ncbi:MAG: agmatinase, partial [Candidatus Melainabacteria bacterium HGW-Melainabacteria-1]
MAGIHTAAPILCDAPPDQLYELVLSQARRHVAAGKTLVTLGGNHCVPIGSCRAACEALPRDQVSILQIDAHSDLRESYQGNAYSHACAMARMQEWGMPVGVGIRSMDISEKENVAKATIFTADYIHKHPNWVDEVVSKLAPNVYLTIDLDGLDPSIMPATGTPEPGGLLWYQVMDLLEKTISSRKLLGFDVVELCPQPGFFHAEFLAAKLTYKIMALNEAASLG